MSEETPIDVRGVKYTVEDYQTKIENIIELLCENFMRYNKSTEKTYDGFYLVQLGEQLSDLATWHRGFREEDNTLPYERDETHEYYHN